MLVYAFSPAQARFFKQIVTLVAELISNQGIEKVFY